MRLLIPLSTNNMIEKRKEKREKRKEKREKRASCLLHKKSN
jgi:hypothetical protein